MDEALGTFERLYGLKADHSEDIASDKVAEAMLPIGSTYLQLLAADRPGVDRREVHREARAGPAPHRDPRRRHRGDAGAPQARGGRAARRGAAHRRRRTPRRVRPPEDDERHPDRAGRARRLTSALERAGELRGVEVGVEARFATRARRDVRAARCGPRPRRGSDRPPGSSRAGARSRSTSGSPVRRRAPAGSGPPIRSRGWTWPRRGSRSAEPSAARARSRAAASRLRTAGSRARRRSCRTPRGATRSAGRSAPRVHASTSSASVASGRA